MRVFHYAYDYYGTGHLQWTLNLAKQVAFEFPEATQLLVTGTPQPHQTKLPSKLDMIKLPGIERSAKGGDGLGSSPQLRPLREVIILNAVKRFDPDIVFIDEDLIEVRGEISLALDYLHFERPETKLITGINNIRSSAMMPRHARIARGAPASSYALMPV